MGLEQVETIPKLAPRPRDAHKGRYGTVLVIAGVTWFARTEEGRSSKPQLIGASIIMCAGLVLALLVPIHRLPGETPIYFPYLLAIFAVWIAVPILKAIRSPGPACSAGAALAPEMFIDRSAVYATRIIGDRSGDSSMKNPGGRIMKIELAGRVAGRLGGR